MKTVLTIRNFWPVCLANKLSYRGVLCDKCTSLKFIDCMLEGNNFQKLLIPVLYACRNKSMRIRKKAINQADSIITVSNYVKKVLVDFGYDEKKIQAIYNIFNTKKEPDHEFKPYFCWAGRFVEIKGLPFLLEAFAKVISCHSNAKLYLIGDGTKDEKYRVNRLITKLKIKDNVVLTGWVCHDEVIEIFSKSTAVVLPSQWPEPLGRIVLESMGCGRPIIATSSGGSKELVRDNFNGFFVSGKDCSELARKMSILLDDSKMRQQMGENGFDFVKNNFNSDVIADKYIENYRSLMDN